MRTLQTKRSRPLGTDGISDVQVGAGTPLSLVLAPPPVTDADRAALEGRHVVTVVRKRLVDDGTAHTITRTYLTLAAAERACRSARQRGEGAEIVLCELRIIGGAR